MCFDYSPSTFVELTALQFAEQYLFDNVHYVIGELLNWPKLPPKRLKLS